MDAARVSPSWLHAGTVDGRRHRGPLLCLGSRAKASTLEGRHRHFTGGAAFHYVFSWALLLVGDTAEVVSSSATSRTELIPHNYRQYWCTQQTACSTHTHTRTVTELFTYEVLLYSSLYLFEYCCFHLNFSTVHPDIVHRSRKRAPLTQSTVREEFVEKSAR